MKTEKQKLGAVGENLVATHYVRRGYGIVERNVRYPFGELDLIVEDSNGTTVFVEVKTRRGTGFGSAESVTGRKLTRMRRAATTWLQGRHYREIRFDVVTVVIDPATGGYVLDHYEGVDDGAR